MDLLHSDMKIFHFPEKVQSLSPDTDEIRAPVHVRIKPTNVCIHNCWYCAYKVDNLQLGKDMVERDRIPKEKMFEILDDLADMGVKAVTFSGGGDPFYYNHLLDTLRKLRDLPLQFASLTNGARLQGEVAELFAQHGTWLRISIDGWDAESYSKYRGVDANEFDTVMKNMAHFKQLGGTCYLGVSIIVDKQNAPHLFDFMSRLKNLGVDSAKISPCIVSNDGDESNRYHEVITPIVKEQVERAKADLQDATFEIYDAYHQLAKFNKEYTWCPYIQILPIIGADLNVYSCQDKAYNLNSGCLGSIRDQRFKDFWYSGKKKFMQINPSKECNHHCVANKKNIQILNYLQADKKHLVFV